MITHGTQYVELRPLHPSLLVRKTGRESWRGSAEKGDQVKSLAVFAETVVSAQLSIVSGIREFRRSGGTDADDDPEEVGEGEVSELLLIGD